MKMNRETVKRYLWLGYINLFMSTFAFGGGYVMVPMIQKYFVDKKQFFSKEDLHNMAAIAQSTPGAIAINLSALSGFRVAGIGGAIISCLATITPPTIILSLISIWYEVFRQNVIIAAILQGMQAGVAALMVNMIIGMFQMILKEKSILLTAMVPCAFAASFFLQINVILILVVCCILCIIRVWWKKRRNAKCG